MSDDPGDIRELCEMLRVPYRPRNRRASALAVLKKLEGLDERGIAELAVRYGGNPLEFMVKIIGLRALIPEIGS